LLAAPALALTGAACAQEADENPLADDAVIGDRRDRGNGDGDDLGEPGTPVPADDLAALVVAAIDDVESYWTETYPEVYDGPFEPLAGGYHPYGPNTELPICGPVPLDYEEIAGNAFYCPSEDLIAWDEATLIPEINETFGGFTVGIVFAHEFAHAIQARANVGGRTIDLELQADCYAGAWTAHVADGGSATFEVSDDELDSTVAGMVAIRDLPGTTEGDPAAHGSAFDRIGSFQEGYENGPQHCADYENTPRRTVQIPFEPEDLLAADPGNFRLEDVGPACPEDLDERVMSGDYDRDSGEARDCGLASLLEADLNVYYVTRFEELGEVWMPIDDLVLVDPARDEIECGGDTLGADELRGAALYCEDENVVVIDGAELTPQLYQIGDFAFGAEVARLWSIAAQAQLGLDASGIDASLQADCMTGLYARSLLRQVAAGEPDSQLLEISPGDLDEGIQGFIAFGDALASETGTAFERTDALRTGVVEGIEGCERDYGELA
jgi:predicted metalloprotease